MKEKLRKPHKCLHLQLNPVPLAWETGVHRDCMEIEESKAVKALVVLCCSRGYLKYNMECTGRQQVKESKDLTCKLITVRFSGICATKYIFSPLLNFFYTLEASLVISRLPANSQCI